MTRPMLRRTTKLLISLSLSSTLLVLGSAYAGDVIASVKIFNYSKYPFTIAGNPVRFSDPAPFSLTGKPAPSKGQQTIIVKQYLLSKNGPAGNDILLKLTVYFPPSGPTECLTWMTYADDGTAYIVKTDEHRYVEAKSDNPTIKCGANGGPSIEAKQSQQDFEIVIDRAGKSWNDNSMLRP